MTIRDLGEAGIKLIGVYFTASSVIGVFRILASLASPPMDGFPSSATIALLNAMPVVGLMAAGCVCVFWGKDLAESVFAANDRPMPGISHHDLLTVGLVLLGVSIAAGALPSILQFIGRVMWLAEGSRQSQLWSSVEQSWVSVTESALELVIGIALAAKAGALASMLERPIRRRQTPT